MNFFDYKAEEVWFTATDMYVQLSDGQIASLPLRNFPNLSKVTLQQLQKVTIINGYALHWEELDEDISIAGFFEKKLENA